MIVARSRTLPPAQTSSTCNRTRSQPLSLLSMARLKRARSRTWCFSCSRIRIAQTSFGLRGRFLPGDTSLVPGGVRRPERGLYFAIHDRLRRADHALPAPANQPARKSIRMTDLNISSDVRSRDAHLRHSTHSGRSLPSGPMPAHAPLLAIPLSIELARLGGKCSFDDLVGAGEDRWWHGEAQCRGSLQIDHQLECGRLLDR